MPTSLVVVKKGLQKKVQYTRSVTRCQTGDGSWQISTISTTTVCQFATYWQSSIVLHTLWRHYFRTRNIVTSPAYLSCLQVVMTRHKTSPLLTTCYGSGVLDMYEGRDQRNPQTIPPPPYTFDIISPEGLSLGNFLDHSRELLGSCTFTVLLDFFPWQARHFIFCL